MKMQLPKQMKASLVAFALQLAIVASAHAGGPAILQLPIEGVTEENSHQCAKLFEEKFRPVLTSWNKPVAGGYLGARMIKNGATNLIVLRPERGEISLSEIDKALKGSPFTVKREQLEYIRLMQLRIGKIKDHEKLVKALATLDGKKLLTDTVEDTDGSLFITLSVPHPERGKSDPLITHQRLSRFLSKNKINLIEISWGQNLHRGNCPFGARLAAVAVEKK
ncbi:MAG: hypothetical protein ACR2RV_24035 [Verrucomicrobiales bacterium]